MQKAIAVIQIGYEHEQGKAWLTRRGRFPHGTRLHATIDR